MAWVRWQHATGDSGPQYCQACKQARRSHRRCDGCTEPLLLEDAGPIIALWLDVQTQWRVGVNGVSGLDYAGVEALMRIRGDIDRDAFAGLQTCERALLELLAERRQAPPGLMPHG